MGEDENIACYVSKVRNLVYLVKGCGEVLTNKMIIEKVMHTFASHFDHVIITIQESIVLKPLNLNIWLVRWRHMS